MIERHHQKQEALMAEKKLQTMDAETLLTTPLPPIRFIADGLIPQGLHILAGAPKIMARALDLSARGDGGGHLELLDESGYSSFSLLGRQLFPHSRTSLLHHGRRAGKPALRNHVRNDRQRSGNPD